MMKVQFGFGLIQFILAIIFGFKIREVLAVFVIWMVLISLECMNTGIENAVDLIDVNKTRLAKRAKDSAGRSVLIISVVSWINFIVLLILNFQ